MITKQDDILIVSSYNSDLGHISYLNLHNEFLFLSKVKGLRILKNLLFMIISLKTRNGSVSYLICRLIYPLSVLNFLKFANLHFKLISLLIESGHLDVELI